MIQKIKKCWQFKKRLIIYNIYQIFNLKKFQMINLVNVNKNHKNKFMASIIFFNRNNPYKTVKNRLIIMD